MKHQLSIFLFLGLALIWTPLHAQWERTEGPSGGMVLSMQSNEDYLFAGTRNGLYRSGDLGKNWQQLANGLPVSFTCHDFDLDHSNLLVHGSYQIIPGDTSDRYRIFKSTDHGDSWQTIFLPDSVNYSSQVVIHDTILFHASKSLLRSTDNGETWSALLTAQDSFYTTQHMDVYDGKLYVVSHRRMWVSEDWGDHWEKINFPNPCVGFSVYPMDSLIILACEYEAYRSVDFGKTWTKAVGWEGANPSHKDIIFQNDTFYTNSSGVLRSIDFGQSWQPAPEDTNYFLPAGLTWHQGGLYACSWINGVQQFHPQADTLQIRDYGIDATTVYSLETHEDELWAGVGYYGLMKYNLDSETWDPKVYFEDQWGIRDIQWIGDSIFISNMFGQVFRSADHGITWKETYDGIFESIRDFGVIGNTLYVISEHGQTISKSDDFGITWTDAFQEFRQLFDTDPGYFVSHHGSIYLTTFDDDVYRSQDGGLHWEVVPTGIDLDERFIHKIFSKGPYLILEIYGFDDQGNYHLYLHASDDDGQTWEYFAAGLPYISYPDVTYTSNVDFAFYGDTLLMATPDAGIFYLTAQDPSWKPLMIEDKFPKSSNTFALSKDKVFVGTNGFGVMQMGIGELTIPVKEISLPHFPLTIYPNPAMNEIQIQTGEEHLNGMVTLFDMKGNILLHHRVANAGHTFSIGHLSPGEYILTLQTKEKIYKGGFVKN